MLGVREYRIRGLVRESGIVAVLAVKDRGRREFCGEDRREVKDGFRYWFPCGCWSLRRVAVYGGLRGGGLGSVWLV